MTLFLTSSPSGCPFEPGPAVPVLDTRNHFVANLRAVWPDHAVLGLAIAADPYAYEQNDEMCRVFAQSFANAHLPLTALIPCDARNAEEIGSLLPQSGFVMLCGGHVPTQNHFFAQLGLPGLFHNYHGIVLGVSAGSMNAAHIVYAAPEEPGEAADPHYSRWMNGLGLTRPASCPTTSSSGIMCWTGRRWRTSPLPTAKSGIFSLCRTARISCAPTAARRCTAEAGTLRMG